MGHLMLRTDPGRGPCVWGRGRPVQGSARCASQWQPTAKFKAGGRGVGRRAGPAGCPIVLACAFTPPALASRAGMVHAVPDWGFVFEVA